MRHFKCHYLEDNLLAVEDRETRTTRTLIELCLSSCDDRDFEIVGGTGCMPARVWSIEGEMTEWPIEILRDLFTFFRGRGDPRVREVSASYTVTSDTTITIEVAGDKLLGRYYSYYHDTYEWSHENAALSVYVVWQP